MDLIGDFYLTHAAWFWAGLAAALLAIEVSTGSGWLLWAAASAGVVAVLEAVLEPPAAVAVLLFAGLFMLSSLTARRYFPRSVEAPGEDINDNTLRLIGREARVVEAFERGAGRVFIDGKEWAAELDGAEVLPQGSRVTVTAVAGSRLKVRKLP